MPQPCQGRTLNLQARWLSPPFQMGQMFNRMSLQAFNKAAPQCYDASYRTIRAYELGKILTGMWDWVCNGH